MLRYLTVRNRLNGLWLLLRVLKKCRLLKLQKRNIVMTNVRGIHKTPMAESVLAHILALQRSLPLIYERQQDKEWNRKVDSIELKGSTALILGPGAIGSEIGTLTSSVWCYDNWL